MTRDQLDEAIIEWAEQRGLIENGKPIAQISKTVEEVAETLNAVIRSDLDGIIDGIGDTYVTLVILTKLYRTDVHECALKAYDEIKNRTGKQVNGMFIKDD